MILAAAFIIASTTSAPNAGGAFANLTLRNAEHSAAEHSPEVAAASAHVRENAAVLTAARGNFGPALSANYAQSPQAGATGGTIEQRLSTIGGQITIGDLFNYSPAVQAAAANLRSAQFDLIAAQRMENVRLIGLYYDALRAVATARTRSDALAAAQEDRRAATVRFNVGDAPRLDIVRAGVALARATAANETAIALQANALEALAVETGMSASLLGEVESQTSDGGSLELPRLEDAVQTALSRRPEIASAQAAMAAEQAAVHSAERGILPVLTITSGYTRGIDSGINVAGPSATAQLTFPLSNASSQRATAERARLEQAQARLAAIQRAVRIEVAAAVRTDDADGRALAAAEEGLRHAQEELDAVTVGYRSGASSSLEVTAARQTYVEAVLDDFNAKYGQAQARATLELLIGK